MKMNIFEYRIIVESDESLSLIQQERLRQIFASQLNGCTITNPPEYLQKAKVYLPPIKQD